MLNPDMIPPTIGWPLAIVLAIVAIATELRARRQCLPARPSLDCLGSRHVACDGCNCHCHQENS